MRWIDCEGVWQELKKLISTKPRRFQEALRSLPSTLHETYDRVLTQIDPPDRADALTALSWVTFEHRPLTLGEIAEATVIDLSREGSVETDHREGIEDVLEILAGLVIVERVVDDVDTCQEATPF